jgi:hypothetical protein
MAGRNYRKKPMPYFIILSIAGIISIKRARFPRTTSQTNQSKFHFLALMQIGVAFYRAIDSPLHKIYDKGLSIRPPSHHNL